MSHISSTIRKIDIVMCQPTKYTFQDKKAFAFVNKYLYGKILNAFAGFTQFHKGEIRVDNDPKMPNLDYLGEDYLDMCEDFF